MAHKYLDGITVKKNDRVVIAQDRPPGYGPEAEFVVVSVNDAEKSPGKVIGLKAGAPSPVLHDLDGAVDANTGWWALPENIAKVTA